MSEDKNSRFKIQFDFGYKGNNGKTITGESETEPDLNLTVRQLLTNHTRGDKAPYREPLYFDVEVPNIQDITDVHAYREHLLERLETTDNFIKNEIDQIEEVKAAKAAKEEQNKKKNEQTRNNAKSGADNTDTSDTITD
jgi:hypothetical protein